MGKFFKHLLTCADNKTFDIARVLWAVSCISFIAIGFYQLYKGAAFDFTSFGTGLAAIMGASGCAVAVKSGSDPGASVTDSSDPSN